MHTIITNARQTRTIEVSDQHLATLQHYHLLEGLGEHVNEDALERLRLHARALLESAGSDASLVDLCHDVIFHDNMKAIGLSNLIALAKSASAQSEAQTQEGD